MLSQGCDRAGIAAAVATHGVAPGAAAMLTREAAAAEAATASGLYACWRSSSSGVDCTRIGPGARCFCEHSYEEHAFPAGRRRAPYPACLACPCRGFAFIPQRCGRDIARLRVRVVLESRLPGRPPPETPLPPVRLPPRQAGGDRRVVAPAAQGL